MPKGLIQADEWAANRATSNQNRTFFKHLWLKDGEFAIIRMLTEAQDMVWDTFHNIPPTPPARISEDRMCVGQGCPVCKMADVKTKKMFLAWCYVRQWYHTDPGENRTPITKGRKTMFMEEINEPSLIQMTLKYRSPFVNRFDEDGTLLANDYKMTRMGTGTATTYLVELFGSATDMEPELLELMGTLPDLQTMIREAADRGNANLLPTTTTVNKGTPVRQQESQMRRVSAPSLDPEDLADEVPF